MDDRVLAQAVVAAAFDLAAKQGWNNVSAASAARSAGLELSETRHFAADQMAIFTLFGEFADSQALSGAMTEGLVKDRLFDILMRRVDFLQRHRPGVLALRQYALLDPRLSVWLARQTVASMGWMLEGAGVSATGLRGELRKRGLAAVWTWTMRAWVGDESEELAATMAALDNALLRADQVAMQFSGIMSDTIAADAPFSEPERPPGRLS